MRLYLVLSATLLLVAGLLACNEEAPTSSPAQEFSGGEATMDQLPPGHPDLPGQESPRVPLRGKVLETMDASRYTYLKVQTTKGEVWAAAGRMKVAVGDEVELSGYTPMKGFHSKTLDRTFDEILFVSQMRVVGAEPSGAEGASEGPTTPPGHPVVRTPGQGAEPGEMPPGHPPVGGPASSGPSDSPHATSP